MHYLVNAHYAASVLTYLARPEGRALAGRLRVLTYEELARTQELPRGAYVFGDLCVSTPATLQLAARVHAQLASAGEGIRLLNDPGRVARRHELLRRLHAEGLNDFRAVRATGPLDGLRYPVFVREECAHTGSRTPLLRSPVELRAALRRLASPLVGHRLADLLVVEFCDTSDGSGMFRTYGAFRVGDRIVRKLAITSRCWVTKTRLRHLDEEAVRHEAEYIHSDRDEAWLRRVFDLAGIEYGRVDYGLLGDRPQLWEINTNPIVGGRKPRAHRPRVRERVPEGLRHLFDEGQARFHEGFRTAMFAIDLPDAGPDVQLHLDPQLVRRVEDEQRAAARARRVRRRLARVRRWGRALGGRLDPEDVENWRPRTPAQVPVRA